MISGASVIHSTAIISPKAHLGANIKIGAFSIIDEDVVVGDNCVLAQRVHLLDGARLGNNNFIGEGTLIANPAQDLKHKGERSFVKIGNNNVIREYVTIHKATGEGIATVIGDNNFIMTAAHVGHDCVIGNNVIMVNAVAMSGHVTVDDFAFISGMTTIHQNVRIGGQSMIGGGSKLSQDVPPYVMVSGEPARCFGLNKVGLKRRGFTKEKLAQLDSIYKIFFRSRLTLVEALKKIKNELPDSEEKNYFIEFMQNSKRGTIR